MIRSSSLGYQTFQYSKPVVISLTTFATSFAMASGLLVSNIAPSAREPPLLQMRYAR